MLQVKFLEQIEDEKIAFAVIAAKFEGKWILCRHEGRSTWEIPGGHREIGETVEEAARRELYEETGAAEYTLRPIGVYSVQGKTPYQKEGDISYGMLYSAQVQKLGQKPESEIAEVICSEALPEEGAWAYPEIQPALVQKVLEAEQCQPSSQSQGTRQWQDARHCHIIENVPFISQLIKYPTGCESVSAVMALQYAGCEITPEQFMDNLLPRGKAPVKGEDGLYYGCDPWKEFPGSPYTNEGWGCFAPVILKAIEGLEGYEAEAYYGLAIDELCRRFIDRDIPVVFWATIDMNEPYHLRDWFTEEGRKIEWINPMHCLLLIGYDETGYIFNDPTGGEREHYSRAQVERAYQAQGRQAVIIQKEEHPSKVNKAKA